MTVLDPFNIPDTPETEQRRIDAEQAHMESLAEYASELAEQWRREESWLEDRIDELVCPLSEYSTLLAIYEPDRLRPSTLVDRLHFLHIALGDCAADYEALAEAARTAARPRVA